MSSRLHNYVRTYRKRSSLGQQDLAFLLGHKSRANVCRIEQGHRLPSLRTALALALILDVSITTLFGGIHYKAQREVAERIATLRSALEEKHNSGRVSALASRQLQWLNGRHDHSQNNDEKMR